MRVPRQNTCPAAIEFPVATNMGSRINSDFANNYFRSEICRRLLAMSSSDRYVTSFSQGL
ncbi:hypothetical protein N7495_004660 [Penicillium taxi]|uniref:uncharacterized protein n=1 Tax=Penicillium taxi TaxID=168475 RepID=UPI002545AB97|nr:uncharacterized protein N7495_004660 [Penicillium taxi]KAJ5899916.1 hypothetical protein N7495_004660 [Penicillium taxi]